MPALLVQCSSLFLSNQTQLYKPNSTEIAGVNLPADAQAHPATGALRARVQSTTRNSHPDTGHNNSLSHSSPKMVWWPSFFFLLAMTHPSLWHFFSASLSEETTFTILTHTHTHTFSQTMLLGAYFYIVTVSDQRQNKFTSFTRVTWQKGSVQVKTIFGYYLVNTG